MSTIGSSTLNAGMMNALSQSQTGKTAQAAQNLTNNVNSKDVARAEEAAKDFEAVFISQMLSHMFSGVEVDPMFGGGQGEEMFRSMMVEEYGKQLADQGGIGIASSVKAKLIEMQASGF